MTASTICKKTEFGFWYFISDLVQWERRRLFTPEGENLARQDLKISSKWDKEMIAIAGKKQTQSHFIPAAALSSAGSGFPVRSKWAREWLNSVQEVAGFINLILWIIMSPSFPNEPAVSKWCRSAFFNVIWINIITVCMFHCATVRQGIWFPKEPFPQAYAELEYSSLRQVHGQNYLFFIERLFKDQLNDFLYKNT